MSKRTGELNQKIDYIYSLLEKKDLDSDEWDRIVSLSKNTSTDVRMAVSEILVNFPTETSEQVLLKMLDDGERIVRVSACDSLCFSHSPAVLDKLLKLSKDDDYLMRGYAALSIGDVQLNMGEESTKTEEFLRDWFFQENSIWVKTAIAYALLILGEKDYLAFLLERLDDCDYQVRSMVLNVLSEYAEQAEISQVKNIILALKNNIEAEKVRHMWSKMEALIIKCENILEGKKVGN